MDKLITFAVAGSGKTSRIIESLKEDSKNLIITYTNANIENIKRKLIKKYGYLPLNISVVPYFSFIYSFCFRPLFHDKFSDTGINYKHIDNFYYAKSDIHHYLDPYGRIFSARIVKSIFEYGVVGKVVDRINKYYKYIFVDEVQDLASRDFDFLSILAKTNAYVELVGDFYQHTYDSSRDVNYNSGLFDDYAKYIKSLHKIGYIENPMQLTHSYRCSNTICQFVSSNLNIMIQSKEGNETKIQYVDKNEYINEIFHDNRTIKLFYCNHLDYNCYSKNWGECKGEDDYKDVCIVLNKKTTLLYKKNKLFSLPPNTRNKLYVALTRARGNIYLVPYEKINLTNDSTL